MFPLRRLLAVSAIAVLATAAFGAAATLGLASDNVAAGSATVADCDDGSVTVDYTGDPGPVTGLTVSGLAAACNGGTLLATISRADGSGAVSSTTPATVTGGSATVTFPASTPPEDVQRYVIVVVTP